MEKIKIGNKSINEKNPCFIIAEAGVNHNGSLKLAKKLIDVAKKSGVDAVKFQTFKTEGVMTKTVPMAEYQKKNTGKKETQFQMIKKLELSFDNFLFLKKYCDKKGMLFLSTPHSEDAIDFLGPLVPVYKVASGDINNIPFLEKIAKKKKPIILSTGMSVLKEIKQAIKTIKKQGNDKIILLHCTTSYPCPLEGVNLKAMLTLKKEFNLPVGYSDHALGFIASIMAVTLGAVVLEKHFTLDKNLPGPDHKVSLEPEELKKMVEVIRNTEKALGNGVKRLTKIEEKNKKIARKSILAEIDIPKGVKIAKGMLVIKRPGTGISPGDLNKVIGKYARKNIKREELIRLSDLV